ncbi:hypothetical protein Mth01_10890 [Sphaerimonospora thailandensis]|uniref:DUF5753 domain-containing protein n=2 Tax=Sphaerimonospora thailandensis TaxID=795644 RepID=A0A8J3VYD9_9ACTN|nr:hypothetical protein Mth01_10890 [Sphaerimonospora thailandensis]
MRSLDVESICRIYGAPDDLTQSLMALAKETKARGWWLSYSDVINEGFDVYIGLEEAAACLRWYEMELVPGLFQIADYARTLIRADNPDNDTAEIERRVQLRIARQTLLTRVTNRPELRVVLGEAILRRPVGGEKVMSAQLTRLIEVSDLPNVELKVMPFEAGMYAGIMSGPFTMLEFPLNGNGKPTEPPIVYVDGFTGALFLDKPHEIERYDTAFNDIWRAALDEAASRDLIAKAAREFEQ